jgi:formate dehydrogenase maturation protein FdhE
MSPRGPSRDSITFVSRPATPARHYIKTIDLTKNDRAVSVVDELMAIPLSLWAAENGYTK